MPTLGRVVAIALLVCTRVALAQDPAPECTHWFYPFVWPNLEQRARVSGQGGLPVTLRHPELCAASDSSACKPHEQLAPSDVITLGHTCGEWTNVAREVEGWARAIGWVQRERLEPLPPTPEVLNARASYFTLFTPEQILIDRVSTADRAVALALLAQVGDRNALPLAVRANRPDIVAALLDRDIAATAVDDPCAMLVEAASRNVDIVRALLREGIDASCHLGQEPPRQDWTPLIAAASINRAAILWRIERGLAVGSAADAVAIVEALLAAGARVDDTDIFGNSALSHAVRINNVDVARVLLAAGADVGNVVEDPYGRERGNTVLMQAVSVSTVFNDVSMLELLLERGANVNYRSPLKFMYGTCGGPRQPECHFEGETALTRAAAYGLFDVVKALLEHGADPLLPRNDGNGTIAADIAARRRHDEVAALLADAAL